VNPRNKYLLIFAALICGLLPGCRWSNSSTLEPGKALEVQAGVRLLADSIARDVTREGATAWLRYFEASPGFFMASGGALAFPDNNSAAAGVRDFTSRTRQIELTWKDVRIDPLTARLAVMGASFREVITDTSGNQMRIGGYFTAVAEEIPAGWRLRDAHWSMLNRAD
jgi:SnoaL-like domain